MSEPAKKITGPTPVPDRETVGAPSPRPRPTIRDLRKQRARRLVLRLLALVVAPTLIAAVYYGAIDTREYESITTFTIQAADGPAAPSLELLFASVPGSSAARDVRIVQDYILSRDMLELLSAEHEFAEHYSQQDVDVLSRLEADATLEERYEYYLDHVTAEFETETGALSVTVRAFSADKSRELATAILESSERMVNRMMTEAREDRIRIAETEVGKVEDRLTKARTKLRALQAERAELDPRASAKAAIGVKSSIEAQLAEARAELNAMRANFQPDAPQLQAQRQKVAALQGQVRQQERRLASGGDEGLSADIAAFEPALADKELAQQAYASALKSLEMARLEADRQHRYLVTIAEPSLPDSPTYPKRHLAILTVFVLAFAAFGIGSLIVASIREHANL